MIETRQPDLHSHTKSNVGIFVIVFVMLCALTGLSYWVANRFVGWGAMVGVSVAKALLVILFFMHLWWERAWKYVLTIPALIMGVLLVMLLVPDVGFRTDTYSKERWSYAPVVESDSDSPLASSAE